MVHLGYLNFTLNATERKGKPTKEEHITDLEKLYTDVTRRAYPVRLDNLTIHRVEVCSSNAGCAPKKNGEIHQHLVAVKNTHGELRPEQKQKFKKEAIKEWTTGKMKPVRKIIGYKNIPLNINPWVVMNMIASTKIGNVEETVYFRIQKTGIVGMRVGVGSQTLFNIKTTDTELMEFATRLSNVILGFLSSQVPNKNNIKVANITTHGYNLITKGGGYPDHKMTNHEAIVKAMGREMDGYFYENIMAEHGKHPGTRWLKPNVKKEGMPAIGISTWGMADTSGASKMTTIRSILKRLQELFNPIKDKVRYNTTSKPPTSRKGDKIGGQCKNNIIKVASIPKNISKMKKGELKGIARSLGLNPDKKLKANILKNIKAARSK
jgi:hypothetical protein